MTESIANKQRAAPDQATGAHLSDKATYLRGLASALALAVTAPMMFYVLPMFLGAVATDHGVPNEQLGRLAFVEYAGKTMGTLLVVILVTSASWRTLTMIGVLLFAASNFVSLFSEGLTNLSLARFGAGFGCGIMFSIALVYVAKTPTPERYFGYLLALQTVAISVLLWFSPRIIATGGSDGLLILMCIGAVLCILPARYVFNPLPGKRIAGPTTASSRRTLGVVVILGHLFWSMTIGGVWTYVERIGDANALDTAYIGRVLSVAMLVSSLGGLAGSAVALRWGRNVPYVIGALTMLGSLLLLIGEVGRLQYVLAAFAFTFLWNFTAVFQLGLIAAIDSGGRYAAFQPLALAAGFGIGPLILGSFLIDSDAFGNAIYAAITFWIVSAAVFFGAAKRWAVRAVPDGLTNAPPLTPGRQ